MKKTSPIHAIPNCGTNNQVTSMFQRAIKGFATMLLLAILFVFTNANSQSIPFYYTGGTQYWTVPNGVNSITITLYGAQGGKAYYGNSFFNTYQNCGTGGTGGTVTGNLNVTPGTVLIINVGGEGGYGSSNAQSVGGFNGGGAGAYNYYYYCPIGGCRWLYYGGGAGGGASDIRIGGTALVNRIAVAAGGGGATVWYDCGDANGGPGGSSTGSCGYIGSVLSCGGVNNAGGGGGSQTGGGAGGNYSSSFIAESGRLGFGGAGCAGNSLAGGGGGGGYYGGGAGAGYGGGGGSNYTNGLTTVLTDIQGGNTGNGQVTISYCMPSFCSLATDSQTQCAGGTFTAITVTETGLSYQWYCNAINSNTGGTSLGSANGAQTNSYTPQTDFSGTLYYYCVVTGTCGTVTSNVSGAFTMGDIVINSQVLNAQTQCLNGTFTPISVSATGGDLSYQWYYNTSNISFSKITLNSENGAQTNSYTPQASNVGTLYYFCVVTGSCGSVTRSSGRFITKALPSISSFTPSTGPVGTLVTITGTNLSIPTAFTIGGVSAIVISNDGTTLVGMVMPGASTGEIGLTTGSCSSTSATNFTIIPTPYPGAQQGNKLVGTGNTGVSGQGKSVAVSADGNTAIVGGYNDNSIRGAAWVFIRSGGMWTQQGSILYGSGGSWAQQGMSVSISADGNTVIIGGNNDNNGQGAAWVWTRSGGVWTQQGNKLVGTGNTGAANQGVSVSLSADGNTALIGGSNDNSQLGATWVWTRSGGVWTQQGSKLVGNGNVGASNQGNSVSVSADGNTAIIGGYNDNTQQGAAWVWNRTGGVWTQQGSKLVGTGNISAANQGISVSVSADGNTAMVGGYNDNYGRGAAWIWTRSGGVWTQQGNKLVGTGNSGTAMQGSSVSVSADGNTAIAGGYYDNTGQGAIWQYTRSGGAWTQQNSKLVGTGNIGAAYQGTSVSVSADGNTSIVGGYNDNTGQGAAWVFVPCNYASISGQATVTQTQCVGGTFTAITVAAIGDGLTYQWFYNTSNSNTGGITLGSANGAQTYSYTPQSGIAGTKYYYCVVTGTCGTATSGVSGAFITNAATAISSQYTVAQTQCINGTYSTI